MFTCRTAVALAVAGVIGIMAGCNKGTSTAGDAPPGGGPSVASNRIEEVAPNLEGKKVFNMQCARCHSAGPGGFGRGPNLAKVGADPTHTVEWLSAFVRDPNSKRENAKMPAFSTLSDTDLKAVAEFLASLK